MSDNFYTLLITSKKKRAAKKITVSAVQLRAVCVFCAVIVLLGGYVVYDYIHLKKVKVELSGLMARTKEQNKQLEGLVAKVNELAVRLEDLRQFDKKVRIMANLEGNRRKQQTLGIGGPVSDGAFLQTRLDGDRQAFIRDMNKNMEKLMTDAALQEASFNGLLQHFKGQKSILAAKPHLWPTEGWVTSGFGYRTSPFTGGREFHRGIDIAARMGKEIIAPADGVVAAVARLPEEGLMIRINHGYGIATVYAHLSKTAVERGGVVKKGNVIGYVGNSGRSTGPHLHYAVYVNDVAVNPRKYLR
ncbi:MAG: peptidoglycan DD-metalloendopeptidase family protein [Deltaproteobacteria bacterium]|nr:peptidoglycan DD-metalloendopeptidase family protein [Deltaproteobacteria bacterium]